MKWGNEVSLKIFPSKSIKDSSILLIPIQKPLFYCHNVSLNSNLSVRTQTFRYLVIIIL